MPLKLRSSKRKKLSSASASAEEENGKSQPKLNVRRNLKKKQTLSPPLKRVKQESNLTEEKITGSDGEQLGAEHLAATDVENAVKVEHSANMVDSKKILGEIGNNNDSESESDPSDTEDGLSAFERRRLSNIRANAEFLAKINLQGAMLDLENNNVKKSALTKTSNPRKFRKKEPLPVRPRSLRIQRKDPEGLQLPERPEEHEIVDEHPRLISGPLAVSQVALEDVDAHAFENLKSLSELDIWTCPDQCDDDYEKVTKSLSKLKLREDKVVKVVKQRVFSLAVHPNSQRLLVAAGEKWGQLGLWDVTSTSEDHGISVYKPHSRPINCLHFSRTDAGKLYSASYDGTVRCCHFETGQFQELYRTSDEYEERCIGFDFLSRDQILVARDDGHVVIVDEREGSDASVFPVEGSTMKSVSVHPRQQNYFIVSDKGGNVHLFDLRVSGKKKKMNAVETLTHGRSVSSAYFSPVTGRYILTTSLDDTVNIYDSSHMDAIKLKHKIRHDNHTGRWLTGFRATWHPAREDLFVVASMKRPRQIELFNSSGQLVNVYNNTETLSSVCSVNVLHPTIPALIGANSSGKLHAFLQ